MNKGRVTQDRMTETNRQTEGRKVQAGRYSVHREREDSGSGRGGVEWLLG